MFKLGFSRNNVKDFVKYVNKDPLQVSRDHFTYFKEGENYYIVDGNTSVQDKPSSNGTTVNGENITGKGKIVLKHGDEIGLAGVITVTFRYYAEGSEMKDNSSPEPPAPDPAPGQASNANMTDEEIKNKYDNLPDL